jgi:hypothetical protein
LIFIFELLISFSWILNQNVPEQALNAIGTALVALQSARASSAAFASRTELRLEKGQSFITGNSY